MTTSVPKMGREYHVLQSQRTGQPLSAQRNQPRPYKRPVARPVSFPPQLSSSPGQWDALLQAGSQPPQC